MTDPGTPPPEPEQPPERQSTPFLVLQFFVFPMAIVAVCVTVFVVFGLIAHEDRTARGYLSEIRSGGANRRWQAAFELSKLLQAGRDAARKDPELVPEAIALFDQTATDDPRVRRYLALALGRLGDRRAVPSLVKSLGAENADSETVIYAAWALGAIGDPSAVPDLARLAAGQDRGIRKAAVHALGGFATEEARAALRAALEDAADDVRWNAALALARRDEAAATPVLLQMLDRDGLAKVRAPSERGIEAPTPEQAEEALLQAIAAAGTLGDPALESALAKLRDADPSLKVREAARQALERR